MQIIEITEPNQKNESENINDIAVGIDFGTTHSLIAISIDQNIEFILNDNGKNLIASIITFQKNGKYKIGDRSNIENSIYSVKRLLGKGKEEILNSSLKHFFDENLTDQISEQFKFKFYERVVTVPEAAAEIFKYLKTQAEKQLSRTISKAVITVPAYFSDTAKGEVLLAAKIAGFEVLRLIAEPTAAAYAYGIEKHAKGQYLIYDFGGGTFDVSVLNMQSGILQVLATGGNNMLGGDDIDQLLANHLIDKYGFDYEFNLLSLAKDIKQKLSFEEYVAMQYLGQEITINRIEFESLIKPILESTIEMCQETLGNVSDQALEGIVLIGGSTRIPLIKKLLLAKFDTEIFSDINPDEAVAMGAALQAENLTVHQKEGTLILDVVPLSLGIELYGGIVEKIILRNSPIPLSITKEFTTYADNQNALIVHVVQGEREMVEDCRSLAKFELLELPEAKAGQIKIEITFSIDANGILSVTALEKISRKVNIVEVKPTFGLSANEIDEILFKAFENARFDHEKKLLQESIIKGETLIVKLTNSIAETPEFIDQKELGSIFEAIEYLQAALKLRDRDFITSQIQKLEDLSRNFSELRIQQAVKSVIAGKNINNL